MKKLFVFGADGLLGNAIVEHVRKREDNEFNLVYELIPLSHNDIDISNRDSVFSLCTPKNIESIFINCAIINDTHAQTTDVKATNVGGVYNLADLATNTCSKLVHISSDYVFWNHPSSAPYGDPYLYSQDGIVGKNTDDPISISNTNNKYADSKIIAENILAKKPCKKFIVRTAWVYGKGKHHSPNNFVSYVMRELLKGNDIKIETIQIGTPTPVTYLARRIVCELTYKGSHIEHIVGTHVESRFTWAIKIAQYLDKFSSNNYPLKSYTNKVFFSHSPEKQQEVPMCTILNNSLGSPVANGSEEKDMKALYEQIKRELQ
jgi:dTDP-4-dehydrorhamnose reductase